MAENTLPQLKQDLIEYVKLQLGDQIVDLELDPAHYEAAYQKTIGTYRQRAENAYEEAYIFMELIRDVNIYTRPRKLQVCVRCSVERLATQLVLLPATLIRLHRLQSTFTL